MTGRDPMFSGDIPVLPFSGRSGSMGSELSHRRAEREDADGTTTHRQDQVIGEIRMSGIIGRTWKDVADRFKWHHGQATGALSPLHASGHIVALASEYGRDGCTVYVTPENVGGRETRAPGRSAARSFRELAQAQEQELNAAKVYIEQLEKDIALANGLADQARLDLDVAREKYVAEGVRAKTEIDMLTERVGRLRESLEAASRLNVAWRAWRRMLVLDAEEQELIETVGQRLGQTGAPTDVEVIKVRLSTLQRLYKISNRLAMSIRERDQIAVAKAVPDGSDS